MRKLFAIATGVALVGATLFGAVYAWSATDSDSDSATVGTVSITATLAPILTAVLGPEGATTTVAKVGVVSFGSLPAVSYTGTVVTGAVTPGLPSSPPACTALHFAGVPIPVTAIAIAADVKITVSASAPDDCQGDSVAYTVNITATT